MMALIKPKITATMISVLATDASLEPAEVPWSVHCSVWIPGTSQAATARATAVTRILTRIFMALFLQDATARRRGQEGKYTVREHGCPRRVQIAWSGRAAPVPCLSAREEARAGTRAACFRSELSVFNFYL